MSVRLQDVLFYGGGECLQKFGVPAWRMGRSQDVAATVTRSGAVGSFVDKDGIVRLSSANRLRVGWLDTDDDDVRDTPTLLIEETATNLLLQSEDFSTTWVNTRSSDSTDTTTAPDGASTADTLIEDATASNTHFVYQDITKAASSLKYSLSVFVKAKERSGVRLNVSDGAGNAAYVDFSTLTTVGTPSTSGSGFTAGAAGSEALANGWYRLFLTCVSNNATTLRSAVLLHNGSSVTYTGDGSSGIYLWGAQLEQSRTPTSYIATTTVAVTRSADLVSVAFPHGPQAMSGYLKLRHPAAGAPSSNKWTMAVGDGHAGSDAWLGVFYSTNNYFGAQFDDGSSIESVGGTLPTPSSLDTVELLWTLGSDGELNLHQKLNGGSQSSRSASTPQALPSAWSGPLVYINSNHDSGEGGVWHYETILLARGVRTFAEMSAVFVFDAAEAIR